MTLLKFIPPVVIPNRVIDSWLTFRARKAGEFEKLIRRLSHYATQHGASSTCMHLWGSPHLFFENIKRREAFFAKCHEGFNMAQNELVKLLPEIEEKMPVLKNAYLDEVKRYKKNREPPIPRYSKAGSAYVEQLFRSMVLREIANSIVWQILGNDGTQVRALIHGNSSGPAQSVQLLKTLTIANKFNAVNKNGFALMTDITSCIQVGDLLVRLPAGGVGFCELKDGEVNEQIESLLSMSSEECPYEKFNELVSKHGKSFVKQVERVLRQNKRMQMALDYINNSAGVDIQFNTRKLTNVKPKEIVSYHNEINRLLKSAKKKGQAYCIIDNCLILGAFNNHKLNRSRHVVRMDFQHESWHMFFESWKECPYGKVFDQEKMKKHFEYTLLPVWEIRHKPFIPTHRPLFISGLEEGLVFDILFERMSVFFYFSPQGFVALCKEKGIDASWVTGKAYRKVKAEASKNGIVLLDMHDGIIEIRDDTKKIVQHIALGMLWKIIYEFAMPSALAELYKEDLATLPERLMKTEEGWGREESDS